MTDPAPVRVDDYVVEVTEQDARGRVAEIYADIRAVLGLPVVNLVYRCLAVEPARLEAVWQTLRPNLASIAMDSSANDLVDLARSGQTTRLPRQAVEAAGVDSTTLTLTGATLDGYARGNSRNLLAMQALLHGCRGCDVGGEPVEAARVSQILPMARLSDLAPETLELLRRASVSLVGDSRPLLVPSLLRHLATAPSLLELLWRALEPQLPSLAPIRAAVVADARSLAASLPFPVSPLRDRRERAFAERFATATSALLVAGETFRAALPESR